MCEINKLKWQCRRSMKELEMVLTRYLTQQYEYAPRNEQHTFQTLLELPDMELYTYLVKRENPAEENMQNLVEKIRNLVF